MSVQSSKYSSTSVSDNVFGGCGTSAGGKFQRNAQTQTIWLIRRAIDIGMDSFSILNVFILPVARSACIQRDAIFRHASTFSDGSCCLPSMNGSKFSPTPNSPSISLTVKPRSAMIEIRGLSSNF